MPDSPNSTSHVPVDSAVNPAAVLVPESKLLKSSPVLTAKINSDDQKKLEFMMVNDFISKNTKRYNPEYLHGLKLSRKRKLLVDGKEFSLNHSFMLMYDPEKNKLVPYMFTHGKERNIPKELVNEKVGFLGRGNFGAVKIVEKQVSDKEDKYLSTKKLALKVLKKAPSQIEVDCLRSQGHLDNIFISFSPENIHIKSYVTMSLLPGSDMVSDNQARTHELQVALNQVLLSDSMQSFGERCTLIHKVRIIAAARYWCSDACAISDKVDVARQLSEKYSKLHADGFAHMDIKGPNIIYDPETNTATPIDFGLASRIGDLQEPKGSPLYLSPEIAEVADHAYLGKYPPQVTGKEDVYSLGIVFLKELKLHLDAVYGRDFKNLIISMMELYPEDRPTMAEVASTINALIQSKQQSKVDTASTTDSLASDSTTAGPSALVTHLYDKEQPTKTDAIIPVNSGVKHDI